LFRVSVPQVNRPFEDLLRAELHKELELMDREQEKIDGCA